MVFLTTFLLVLAWLSVSDACSPGFGFDQLRESALVGRNRDDPVSNVMNFAASVDPVNQTMTSNQLSCTSFDNRCMWRTSNLSTLPWFQSNYKFDTGVLKYATGTEIQPEGDYAIAVSQMANRTDYAVLESPSICQVGNGYLQVMLWASNGVRVQACSKANSASVFEFCTLFMTENQPGPYSVIIPPSSQMPLRVYIVATNFNYTDSQYSGGFAAVDQIAYSATDCNSTTGTSRATPRAPNAFAVKYPDMMSDLMSPSSTGTIVSTTMTAAINKVSVLQNGPLIPAPTPLNTSIETEMKNITDLPDVTVTPEEEPNQNLPQKSNFSTFYLSGQSENNAETSAQVDESSGPKMEQTENVVHGSGSSDNETDSDMVAAKTDDELAENGSGQSDDYENGGGFVFNLPDDVTAASTSSSNNSTDTLNSTTTIAAPPPTTSQSPTATTAAAMPMNNMQDESDRTKDPNQEELPQIFHPSGNRHQRPQHPQTTTQPPWYEFTTLYPGQRQTQQTMPPISLYPNHQTDPQRWIDISKVQRSQK